MTAQSRKVAAWVLSIGGIGGTAVLGLAGYALAQAQKVPVLESRIDGLEQGIQERLSRIEKNLEKLLDLHLRDNGKSAEHPDAEKRDKDTKAGVGPAK